MNNPTDKDIDEVINSLYRDTGAKLEHEDDKANSESCGDGRRVGKLAVSRAATKKEKLASVWLDFKYGVRELWWDLRVLFRVRPIKTVTNYETIYSDDPRWSKRAFILHTYEGQFGKVKIIEDE